MPYPVCIFVTIICLSEDCGVKSAKVNKFQISKQVHVYRTWLVIGHMYVETIKRGRHWCHCLVWNYGWSSNSVKAKIAEVTKHSMWTAVQNGWNTLMNFYSVFFFWPSTLKTAKPLINSLIHIIKAYWKYLKVQATHRIFLSGSKLPDMPVCE